MSAHANLSIQMLWQLHIDWDESLDNGLQDEWNNIITDLQQLSGLTIDWSHFQDFTREGIQLNVFADASTKACGAVAFLTSSDDATIVMAKNRVAILDSLTLPKLELMAAAVASRVAGFIIDALQQQDNPIYCLGNSQIVLYWLKSTIDLPLFVRCNILEITEAIPGATWNYCPTVENPTDLLKRGINFQLLSSPNNLWWKGPPRLITPSVWPQWQPEPTIELRAAAVIAEKFIPQPTIHTTSSLHALINISDCSTLNRLLTVTAYTYRYINKLHKSRPKLDGPLTATELT